MTLIAAFRCRDNGILMCADRMEDDGVATRAIDKIQVLIALKECDVYVSGSGITITVEDAYIAINRALREAQQSGVDLLTEHKRHIEESLKGTLERYKEYVRRWPLHLLIVVAPRQAGRPPILYRTDKHRLVETAFYAAFGSGKNISDYLADRLYKHGLQNITLITLGAFILREAEHSASGVGLGKDMMLINPGIRSELHTDSINEIQAGIPPLKDVIFSHWSEHVTAPEWLIKNYAASDES